MGRALITITALCLLLVAVIECAAYPGGQELCTFDSFNCTEEGAFQPGGGSGCDNTKRWVCNTGTPCSSCRGTGYEIGNVCVYASPGLTCNHLGEDSPCGEQWTSLCAFDPYGAGTCICKIMGGTDTGTQCVFRDCDTAN